jgi:hypothetical protein
MMMAFRGILLAVGLLTCSTTFGQLSVTPIGSGGVTKDSMAAALLGVSSGITINSVTYVGANGASGTFTGGTSSIGIDSGILLTNGSVNNVLAPNDDDGASTDNGLGGDTDLDTLTGDSTFDASTLTINFTPSGSQIQFSYVFGSEEYPEYVGEFNDAFALFVNGVNRALVPGTSTAVTINNINCGSTGVDPTGQNCSYYVNNVSGTLATQLDGFTKVLTLVATVNPGVPNTIKIAIADALDHALDTAVFIAGGTLTVCGGPSQPACGVTATVEPVDVPTLSEWGITLLALITGGFAALNLRRRRD